MNAHVKAMQEAISTFNNFFQAATEKIERIHETYGPEAMKKELDIQQDKLRKHRIEAEQAIERAYQGGVESVRIWGQLDGSDLTDDVKLLSHNLMTPDDFERLKAKYANNYTMLTALRQFGDKENKREAAEHSVAMSEFYNISDIPTVSSKMEAWAKVRATAFHLIDIIGSIADGGDLKKDWALGFEYDNIDKTIDGLGKLPL